MSLLRSVAALSHRSPLSAILSPVKSSSLSASSIRYFSKSSPRKKALENWKRPSIDEIGVPKEPWQHVYARNQKKYNAQLIFGTVLFGCSSVLFYANVDMLPKLDPKSVKFSSILPVVEKEDVEDEGVKEEEVSSIGEVSDSEVLEEEDKAALSSVQDDVAEDLTEPEAESSPAAVPAVPEQPVTSETAAATEEKDSTKPSLEALPAEVPYLLIGAGTASFAAFRAIKARDPTAKILIVGDEDRLPYMRPPLSKELWFVNDPAAKEELKFKQWNGKERTLYYEPQTFYTPLDKLEGAKNGGISIATGRKVVRIDTDKQIAYLADGAEIKYEKCLLATGGSPKSLDVLKDLSPEMRERFTLFRNVKDFHNLDKIVDNIKSVTIFGGGFLGSELACALGQRAKLGLLEVNQAYQEKGNMAKVLPEYLSDWTTEKVKSEGVNVLPNSRIKGVSLNSNNRLDVELSGGKLETDHVVVAVGIEPDNNLAAASNIQVDGSNGGYLVDDKFQASPNLWVAGDAAAFLDPQLGRRRVEHHDHAVVSGRLAGENMTGADKSYTHQSMFWSDLGPEVGYEAIGIVDSKLPTVGVFAKATATDTPKAVVTKSDEADRSISEQMAADTKIPAEPVSGDKAGEEADYGKGVIFYLKENKVVGILLWNVFNRMKIARSVLKEGKSYDDLTEVAKHFNIHAAE